MEEILASIRRIIADDQPLGAQPSHEPQAALAPPEPHAPAPPQEASVTSQVVVRPEHIEAELPPKPEPVTQRISPESPAETRHPLAPPASEPVPATAATLDNAYEISAPQPDVHEAALAELHDEPGVREAVLGHDVYEARIFETQVQEEQVRELLEHQVRQSAAEEPPMSLREPPVTKRDTPEDPVTAGLFSAATSQSLASAFNTLAISRLADDSQELRGLAREMLRPLLKDWLDEHLPGLVESIIREEIDRMARRGR